MKNKRINEIKGLVVLAIGLIMLASLISFSWEDIFSFPRNVVHNWIRTFGAYLAGAEFLFFGWSAYIICFFIFWWAIKLFKNQPLNFRKAQLLGLFVFLASSSVLFSLLGSSVPNLKFNRGGLLGVFFEGLINNYFGKLGTFIIFFTFALLSFSLLSEVLISAFFLRLWQRSLKILKFFKRLPSTFLKIKKKESASLLSKDIKPNDKKEELSKTPQEKIVPKPSLPTLKIEKIENSSQESALKIKQPLRQEKIRPLRPAAYSETDNKYKIPPLDLLNSVPPLSERQIKEDLTANARILEETLADFGISAKVTHIERGPVITRYELEPAAGVKLQRIVSLSDDIALNLKAISIRVVAPIPGKGRVGVEVPNSQSSFVYLKEVLASEEFQNLDSFIPLAIGKDITGKPVVADLREMPHLLIAGATGSGKTVCVNALILSILFRSSPQDVKFIMVDPKMVELAIFNGLAHLICPVVTDVKKVKLALQWLVNEMEQRYKLFANVGARNIEIYNQKQEKIPYIVVIIDELADLMAVAGDQIELAITRLAQLSRAVGIHLILATQRPSVDVITGVIKANFPARISFKVASKVDSRTVLDMNGADKLLGKGDLLFLKPGDSRPIRAQGSLVADKEIERVVEFIRAQSEPIYEEEILEEKVVTSLDTEKDTLYEEAVRLIMESGQASASFLQRRLRLGYTRAARIIDMMEQEGLLGAYEGSKPRKIIVDREAWLKKNLISKNEPDK